MKILVIGDPHFKINNVKDTALMTQKILEIATTHQPDLIVNLGDTLDRHESIHVSPLSRATEFLIALKKISHTVLIIGNHDRPNNSDFLTEIHPFTSFKSWENFTVVDTPTILQLGEYKLLFVPYVAPGRYFEALNTSPDFMTPLPSLIFSHQEFQGAKMGPIISIEGDVWPLDYPYNISGHIHDYDQLQPNLLYPGTPIPHGFGDTSGKGIIIVTLPEIYVQRIPLNIANKVILKVKFSEVIGMMDKINEMLEHGTDVKIIVEGNTAENASISKRPEISDMASKIKLVFKDTSEIEDKPVKPIDNRSFLTKLISIIEESKNRIDLMESYREIFSS